MERAEQMKEMIRNEIQSIENLKERVAFKEMIEGVFLTLYEANELMYKNLESRVINELTYDINRYQIKTGLIERNYLDQSHHLMSAICEEDLESSQFIAGDLRAEIKTSGKVRLATVFVQCDSIELKSFFENQSSFTGLLYTDKAHPVSIKVEMNKRYLSQIEHLYHLFMKNGVPWNTVNAPYLFKMADVYITDISAEIPDHAPITKFGTDFGEFNPYIHYDMIPVWNIQRLKLNSVGFPIACGDYENYEHTISIRKYGAEHAYLVEEKKGIRNIRQSGDKLMITGQISNAKKWDVYIIRKGSDHKIDRYTYPIMENFKRDGFAERFQRRSGQPVKTKGELRRIILGFGLEHYIEYQDCALIEPGTAKIETYSMNFFLHDEIREKGGRKFLILYFKPQSSDTWILRDLASFISSEVQELYPEYDCGGVLV